MPGILTEFTAGTRNRKSILCLPTGYPRLILTLTARQMKKSYWLGGVFIPTEALIQPTVRQISRILNGEPADSIPFIHVTEKETSLNVPALKRFGLEEQAGS